MLAFRERSRRSLSLGTRDLYGLNAFHRLRLKTAVENIQALCELYQVVQEEESLQEEAASIGEELVKEFTAVMEILVVDVPQFQPRERYPRQTFDSMKTELERLRVDCSARFRFQSFDQLTRLVVGLRFPAGQILLKKGYRTTAEEIVLVSLSRLSFPCRWQDLYERFPGRTRQGLQIMFYYFLDFIINNWAYLLLNNMPYWLPHLPASADAIRRKLQLLNHEEWRLYFPPGGFDYCCLIDNTMVAFCRPGGVIDEGPAAQRVPEELQEAWWSGWKKFHGMKWQTLIMANGMDLHVYGPESFRHNDLFTLAESNILLDFQALQAGQVRFLKIFGDSAYVDGPVMGTGGGRGMASVRETIEWSYKDLKSQWKYCDYRHVLQVRKQPVAKIVFVCMFLRNAYVTMNGGQVGEYLNMMSTTLEEWLAQGPEARPIPLNSCFHPAFRHGEADGNESDEHLSD